MTIKELIQSVIDEKKSKGIAPELCTRRELDAAINNELNRLYQSGEIKVGPTANDKYITIVK